MRFTHELGHTKPNSAFQRCAVEIFPPPLNFPRSLYIMPPVLSSSPGAEAIRRPLFICISLPIFSVFLGPDFVVCYIIMKSSIMGFRLKLHVPRQGSDNRCP